MDRHTFAARRECFAGLRGSGERWSKSSTGHDPVPPVPNSSSARRDLMEFVEQVPTTKAPAEWFSGDV